MKFKEYKRKQIAELRGIDTYDLSQFEREGKLKPHLDVEVSISQEDLKNGSPKIGDMIARNPKNHLDQWLVAKEYFNDNFEEV